MRESFNVSRVSFYGDYHSIVLTSGISIDWDNVDDAFISTEAGGKKILPAGTVVGNALSASGHGSPRVVTTNPATGILLTPAVEGDTEAVGLIVGGHIYGNLLPGGMPSAAVQTELNAAGTGFRFSEYFDSRAS